VSRRYTSLVAAAVAIAALAALWTLAAIAAPALGTKMTVINGKSYYGYTSGKFTQDCATNAYGGNMAMGTGPSGVTHFMWGRAYSNDPGNPNGDWSLKQSDRNPNSGSFVEGSGDWDRRTINLAMGGSLECDGNMLCDTAAIDCYTTTRHQFNAGGIWNWYTNTDRYHSTSVYWDSSANPLPGCDIPDQSGAPPPPGAPTPDPDESPDLPPGA